MNTIHSLYYHNPDMTGFEKMVKYHKRHGYRFISITELYEILLKKESFSEKMAFISFDDGWQGNLRLLTIIEKYNVPICIFVATEPLVSGNFWWEYVTYESGYNQMLKFKKLPYSEFCQQLNGYKQRNPIPRSAMTVEELCTLSHHPLVSIQSHTVNHPILTSCPDDILENELVASKSTLENLTGRNVFAFSYPNGSLTTREIKATMRHYALAFTTEQNHISVNDNLFTLPRYALTGQYYRDLLKIWGIWKRLKSILRR